jgi:CheY-like chemotaxis protein
MTHRPTPLRIFYLEDNPLIVFHVEAMIEDLGHVFAGSADSFVDLKRMFDTIEADGMLVDIDLADGRTGPAAAEWLRDRGMPVLFVTGQAEIAGHYQAAALGFVRKPISASDLAEKLGLFPTRAR